jgi:hypothetical protein
MNSVYQRKWERRRRERRHQDNLRAARVTDAAARLTAGTAIAWIQCLASLHLLGNE